MKRLRNLLELDLEILVGVTFIFAIIIAVAGYVFMS
jgi:hypothetical protein